MVRQLVIPVAVLLSIHPLAAETADLDLEDEKIKGRIAAKTTSIAPPNGSADCLNNTFANFLPLIQGVVDAVCTGEDKKSLTIKFNPIRTGLHGNFAIATTIAEPEIFNPLEDQIVESAREAQSDLLLNSLNDFSDLTLELTYGFQKAASDTSLAWGRNYELYKGIRRTVTKFLGQPENRNAISTFSSSRAEQTTWDALLDNPEPQYERWAAMIHNQPQLIIKSSYRLRDDLVGPDSYGVTLSYELGTKNVNSMIRKSRKSPKQDAAAAAAFLEVASNEDVTNEDKFVFSVTYNGIRSHSVIHDYEETITDPATMTPVTIPHSAVLDLPRSHDLCGKLQWSRYVHTWKHGEPTKEDPLRLPHVAVSAEYVDVSDDEERSNRFIARATYTLPLGPGLSLPISVTYANRPEFLGEHDRILSAHLGISYKLDRQEPTTGEDQAGGGGKQDWIPLVHAPIPRRVPH